MEEGKQRRMKVIKTRRGSRRERKKGKKEGKEESCKTRTGIDEGNGRWKKENGEEEMEIGNRERKCRKGMEDEKGGKE